jgi:hypothetical protein
MHAIRYAAALSFFLITGQAISARACTYGVDMGTVCYLEAGYDKFDVYGNGYKDPRCDGRTIDPDLAKQILAAISHASGLIKFQNDICNLKYIFVTDDALSWGFWEGDKQVARDGIPNHTYIGLSKSVFNTKYSDIELGIHNTLDKLSKRTLDWQVYFDQDSNEMGLLFAIAHELGHITFAKNRIMFVKRADCKPSNTKGCFYDNFIQQSWKQKSLDVPSRSWRNRRWTAFGDQSGTEHLHSISNIAAKSAQDICDILQTSEFVGLFGSVSPDEDFVEMYRLSVLLNANPPPDPSTISVSVADKGAKPACTFHWSDISGYSMVKKKLGLAFDYAK